MRRVATLGLVAACGLGGGCADFDDWMEPEHTAEYRSREYQRDDRGTPATPPKGSSEPGPGVYTDR